MILYIQPMSDGMGRELAYLSSHATNRYFIPNWGIYGMSMMFFSMMAFLFWRKGKERLFRMIMWLMIVVDLQLVKDMVFFLIYGFDNEHAWYLTSSLDMMIIPFYSFVLMDLVKPGWFRWLKALMLELPFLLLPVFYIFTHNIIWFYVLSVWECWRP